MFAYLSLMGWPGIYSICFSQLDGDKDYLLLDGGFSFLIAIRLIRNNWKAIIENYPTSLIGEILFYLQDKQLLENILLSLLVIFGLIYRISSLLGIILLPLFVRFGLIYRISSYWDIFYFPYW